MDLHLEETSMSIFLTWELEKLMPFRLHLCSLAGSECAHNSPHHPSVTHKSTMPPLSPVLLAIHSTVHLLKLGSPPPHKEARQRRKEIRRKLLAEQEQLERQMKELQAANENKQQELESVRKVGAGQGGLGHGKGDCPV